MSQKINPNSLRLGTQKSWESVWFSDPRKRKQSYAKLLHEDLNIQNYLRGFFLMFDVYQADCQVKRKPNGELQINVEVYKDQRGQNLTPKDQVLKEGLDKGWMPFIIMKTLGTLHSEENQSLNQDLIGSSSLTFPESKTYEKMSFDSSPKHSAFTQKKPTYFTSPPHLGGQESESDKFAIQTSRFAKEWNTFQALTEGGNQSFTEVNKSESSRNRFDSKESNWWSERSWESEILINSSRLKKVSLTIQPVKTLVQSPKLVAAYISSKIENSTPVQGVFNEIMRTFELDVKCVGPDFEKGSKFKDMEGESKGTKDYSSKVQDSPIIVEGFRLQCSGRIQMYPKAKPAEKAEILKVSRGNLPLNTIYENIQFAQTSATNEYGTCGVKVWINYASKG